MPMKNIQTFIFSLIMTFSACDFSPDALLGAKADETPSTTVNPTSSPDTLNDETPSPSPLPTPKEDKINRKEDYDPFNPTHCTPSFMAAYDKLDEMVWDIRSLKEAYQAEAELNQFESIYSGIKCDGTSKRVGFEMPIDSDWEIRSFRSSIKNKIWFYSK
jgi:hypothetical protein